MATLVVLNPHVSDRSIQLKRQAENVAVVTAVTNQKRAIRLIQQHLLRSRSADGTPIPITLQINIRKKNWQKRGMRKKNATEQQKTNVKLKNSLR